ncbi:hypothetical protein DBV15_10880, partial [Temnothorax longispinosus]
MWQVTCVITDRFAVGQNVGQKSSGGGNNHPVESFVQSWFDEVVSGSLSLTSSMVTLKTYLTVHATDNGDNCGLPLSVCEYREISLLLSGGFVPVEHLGRPDEARLVVEFYIVTIEDVNDNEPVFDKVIL